MIKNLLFIIACLLFNSEPALTQLSVAEIFTDNMVLQRDQPIKVWGWSEVDTEIVIDFLGKNYKGTTDDKGKWVVKMPSFEAGGPYKLSIQGGEEKIILSNILVGDVWLCSGQSNMEWIVANSNNATEEIAAATDEGVRHFKVPRSWSKKPEQHLDSSQWLVNNSDNT